MFPKLPRVAKIEREPRYFNSQPYVLTFKIRVSPLFETHLTKAYCGLFTPKFNLLKWFSHIIYNLKAIKGIQKKPISHACRSSHPVLLLDLPNAIRFLCQPVSENVSTYLRSTGTGKDQTSPSEAGSSCCAAFNGVLSNLKLSSVFMISLTCLASTFISCQTWFQRRIWLFKFL